MVFSGRTSSLPQKPLYQNFVAKGERWGISGKQKKDRLIIYRIDIDGFFSVKV